MSWFLAITAAPAFLNGFGVFVGIVAGVIIQQLVNHLQNRKFARNAFRVLRTEIAYNRSEVQNLRKHIEWLKSRIAANQISENDLFIPMSKFDYSTIGPLTQSGHFHTFLGPETFRSYLEFTHFFRNDNGGHLTQMLRAKHGEGKSFEFLEWIEGRADILSANLEPIERAKLSFFSQSLKLPTR